jgi:hypothetical protein
MINAEIQEEEEYQIEVQKKTEVEDKISNSHSIGSDITKSVNSSSSSETIVGPGRGTVEVQKNIEVEVGINKEVKIVAKDHARNLNERIENRAVEMLQELSLAR